MAAPRYQNARWFVAGVTVAAVVAGTAFFLDEPATTAAGQPAATAVAPAPAASGPTDNRVTTPQKVTTKKSRSS